MLLSPVTLILLLIVWCESLILRVSVELFFGITSHNTTILFDVMDEYSEVVYEVT